MNKDSHTTETAIDANTVLTPVFPLCLRVKYELSNEFIKKVNSEGCKIEKVIELLNCKMLEYWINCPKEKEELITDFAFMTWIKNPVFQKYYHGTKAFEKITEQYIIDLEPKNIEIETLRSKNDELRKALILGLYHDGWAEENGTPLPINNPKLGAPKWVISGFAALS